MSIDIRPDAIEATTMDLWRITQMLTLAEPVDLATNLTALIEARGFLAVAIDNAIRHQRRAA